METIYDIFGYEVLVLLSRIDVTVDQKIKIHGKYTCYKEERKEGKFSDRCQGDKETNCHGETEERN